MPWQGSSKVPEQVNLPPSLESAVARLQLLRVLKTWMQATGVKVNRLAAGAMSAREGASTTAPTSGTWAQGDWIANSNPVETGPTGAKYVVRGWTCVVGGTPGVWVEDRAFTAGADLIAVLAATLTDGSIPFASGNQLAQDNANLRWDNTNKYLMMPGGLNSGMLMIGISTPTWSTGIGTLGTTALGLSRSYNNPAGIITGTNITNHLKLEPTTSTWNISAAAQYNVVEIGSGTTQPITTTNVVNYRGYAINNSPNTVSWLKNADFTVVHGGTGTLSNLVSLSFIAATTGVNTVSSATGVIGLLQQSGTGTISDALGANMQVYQAAAGTIGVAICNLGMYRTNANGGTATNVATVASRFLMTNASIVTNLYAFAADVTGTSYVWSKTAGTVTNSYGLYLGAGIDVGSTSRWAIYSLSTSQSYLAGDIRWKPPAAQTLSNNGDFGVEFTSNTNGNLVYRGSDGTTRRFAFVVA